MARDNAILNRRGTGDGLMFYVYVVFFYNTPLAVYPNEEMAKARVEKLQNEWPMLDPRAHTYKRAEVTD